MDLESRDRWVEYSKAKDVMFAHTNIPEAPWFTVKADDKKRARLNCVYHILSKIPYVYMTPQPLELSPRKSAWNLRLKMLLPLPSSDCRGRNLLMDA
jgi:hypothetical protein